MRNIPIPILISLAAVGLVLPALAQKPAPQQQVTVVVDDANSQPPQPVKAASVSVMFQQVTDARGVTNSNGQVLLQVSPGAGQQSNLRVEISGAGNLVIYQPPEGALTALPPTVNVSLLPKGSPALLGPAQIQAMLHRMSLEVSSLEKQNTAMQTQLNASQQSKPDLGGAIADWAQANGFSAAQVDNQVQQWAESIQKQSAQATDEQKALAQLALKNFGAAAQLFGQASNAQLQSVNAVDSQMQALAAQVKALQAAQQALAAQQIAQLRPFLQSSEQEAVSYQLNLQYREATQALETAEAKLHAEYKTFSDPGIQSLWLQSVADTAAAHWMEGQVTSADQSIPELAQAASEFQTLAGEYTTLGEPQLAAEAQSNVAVVLLSEGVRVSGDQAMAMLDQAKQAYISALAVYSKANAPDDWALAENNLAVVLLQEGSRVTGDQALSLLDQADQAVQSALEIRTKDAKPDDWALSQIVLGNVLLNEGMRTDPAKAVPVLQQSVQALENALSVFTRTDHPLEWSEGQIFLGSAFNNLGLRSSKDQVMGFSDKAVQAYQQALQVLTEANSPQEWAQTKLSLATTLITESYVSADKASTLLDEAVADLGDAGKVFTSSSQLAQPWASSQVLLGNALYFESMNAKGDDAKALALLQQAEQAFRNALQIYSPGGNLAQFWALTQMGLSYALTGEAERMDGDKSVDLLNQAVQGFQAVLQVFTRNDPQQWAGAQLGLGVAFLLQAERSPADKQSSLFDQSAQAYQNALQVYTQSDMPQFWAATETGVVTLDLVRGDYPRCLQEDATLNNDALTPYQGFIRDALKLTCEWGAHDKASALATAKMLLAQPFPSQYTLIDVLPATYCFAHAPAFATGRVSWVAFANSIQSDSSSGVNTALQQLLPILQP